MSQQILLTTTGTQSPVTLNDMGGRMFTHPTTNYDLLQEYKFEALRDSFDLQSAINSGYVTLTDDTGFNITNVSDNFVESKTTNDLGIFVQNITYTSGTSGWATAAANTYALNNQSAPYYLNRTNHTGTQTSATISDFTTAVNSGTSGWATNAANAYLLNNNNSSFYLSRTNHTGTQTSSTISDFTSATNSLITSGTSGYANNAASAYVAINANNLNNQLPSFYLSRANHTGTQLSSTISDFTTAVNALNTGTSGWATNAANAYLFNNQNPAFYLNRSNQTGTETVSVISDLSTNGTAAWGKNSANAYLFNNQNAAFYLSRSNQTGTQLANTISDLSLAVAGTSGWATTAANSLLFNNNNSSFYLSRSNQTGTQLSNTISDFSNAVLTLGSSSTSGYATNAASAFVAINANNLNNQLPSFYLNRANHTGTQLSNTISDFNNAVLALGTSSTAGWATNAANAYLFNNQNAAFYLNRSNFTGTQTVATISDLSTNGTSGWATNAANSYTLNSQNGAYYLNRSNHVGNVVGDLSLNNNLNVAGNVNVVGLVYSTSGISTSKMTVSGASILNTLSASVINTNAEIIGTTLNVNGDINTNADVNVQGFLYSTSGASVGGLATFNNLNANGNISGNGNISTTVGNIITTTGSFTSTTGGITVGTTVAGANVTASNNIVSSGNIFINGGGKLNGTAGWATNAGNAFLFNNNNAAFYLNRSNFTGTETVSVISDLATNGTTGWATNAANGFLLNNNNAAFYQNRVNHTGTQTVSTISDMITNGTAGFASDAQSAYGLTTNTGAIVNVFSSAAPSSGQFLIATSATAATWQNLVNNSVGATGTLNVTATAYSSGINGSLTLTPVSGTYFVNWSASVTIGTAAATVNGAIHVGGTINTNSERQFKMASGGQGSGIISVLGSSAFVTVNGSQAIEVRFIVSSGTGVLTFRSMNILKIA